MSTESVVDRLVALPQFQSVPRSELEWLVDQGDLRTVPAGTTLVTAGEHVPAMWILVAGRVGFSQQKGGGSRRLMEAVAGQAIGILPYSRAHISPGAVTVEQDVIAVVLDESLFPIMIRDHPQLTTAIVHQMLDRARDYRTVQLNDERLESLSRLASGFAHELNNPASAAARTARSLVDLLDEQESSARELAAARLSRDHLAAVDAIRGECRRTPKSRTALEAADREDDMADWLTRHGLESDAAGTLATSDVSLAALEDLARTLPADCLGIAVRWIASGCAARLASQQITTATARIHDLVAAVKGFTFMDRQGTPEEVDVARGLADTLAMLEAKARSKSATVHLETAAGLPSVHGFGSEINQVWEKLVDNAIDAVGDQGHVTVTATTRGDSILVRVADDGPGIPEEIRARVFDPFFTTKPVGQGTGLGLDMARRIVHVHGGDIGFSTQPGRTVFRVMLPVGRSR